MPTSEIKILAIESSCDETSAALIYNGKILNNIVATQSIHEKYGGVVPELASRAHQQNIVPVVDEAMKNSGIDKSFGTEIDIDNNNSIQVRNNNST